MAVKQCCIEKCKSSTTRKEDKGVTYHKFPKDKTLHKTWTTVTHYKRKYESRAYVCSRHFCKTDFQIYKDSKYILKSDAVPSIFPWLRHRKSKMEAIDDNMSLNEKSVDNVNVSTSSKKSEPENIQGLGKCINKSKNNQEQNLANRNDESIKKEETDKNMSNKNNSTENEKSGKHLEKAKDFAELKCMDNSKDGAALCSSTLLDIIMNENVSKQKKTNGNLNQTLKTLDKGNISVALSIGSKVEAKDYSDDWHMAEIVEVDYEEMEVLVRYSNDKRQDEWINISSPRLRANNSKPSVLQDTPSTSEQVTQSPVPSTPPSVVKEEPKEIKQEEKSKVTFEVGERCLARWRDNRRFTATILNKLEDGTYEITFDDGFYWKCSISRLYKWKPNKSSNLSMDSSYQSPSTSHVQYGSGPSAAPLSTPFHTHLFDPTRDYLGSKSERREMKRKLNIKEIFNIGQKKSKMQKAKEAKAQTEKKIRVIKRVPKVKVEHAKVKLNKSKMIVKNDVPDAIASIIGTVTKDESSIKYEEYEMKNELPTTPTPMDTDDTTSQNDETLDETNDAYSNPDDSEVRSDSDPVLEEETLLEKFEQPDEAKHEQVMDRMKEVINKLEDNINQIEQTNSPKLVPKEEIKEEIQEPIKEVPVEEPSVEEPPVEEPPVEESKEVPVNEVSEKISEQIGDQLNEMHSKESELEAPELEPKLETPEIVEVQENVEVVVVNPNKPKKLSKMKRNKKIRLLQEKKVKKQVEQVKNELEEMKRQVEEMRQQMLAKTEELAKARQELPESCLLPGEWCCRWVDRQPVGTLSQIDTPNKLDANNKPALPRVSVQVEDKRLPPGWSKHLVRRSHGNSAGKWDVVLVNPENRRFHTKMEMRNYLDNERDQSLKQYEYALLDFGVHLKLARRMGWMTTTPGGEAEREVRNQLNPNSPLVKRKRINIKKIKPKNRFKVKFKKSSKTNIDSNPNLEINLHNEFESTISAFETSYNEPEFPPLEDGFVYVGSLKVQIIDNLLRCPAEGCFKNFRNNTLLQMHIKHYHRELRKMLGATPKVADLAYARTVPTDIEPPTGKANADSKVIKAKSKPKREEPKELREAKDGKSELKVLVPQLPLSPPKPEPEARPQDSPKLRLALNKHIPPQMGARPQKRPKVLLPVRRPEPETPESAHQDYEAHHKKDIGMQIEALDFETAISTHTVTKPLLELKKKEKFAALQKQSDEEDWFGNSDVDTRSSFARSGTPDSKTTDGKIPLPVSSESNEDLKDANMYMYNENGERIKIVHMKREEIINCHCGFREEDGLMVQCELCLCWQHALCHNIQREADVPEKYTCSICLNPRRGRRSQRFLHDQDRMYEGLLPGSKPCDSLRRSHELTGNLLKITDAVQALRVKFHVATKKNHPKLYLWAKDWEQAEIAYTQEKLNSDYTNLNIMISDIGKENLPLKAALKDVPMDMRTPPSEDHDRFLQRDASLASQSLLSGFLSSPDGASLELPISTCELERLAKSVQEQEQIGLSGVGVVRAPEPEAAIDNSVCRKRLLRHVQRCQALIDARLDSIEAQVAELESQDQSLEDDEPPVFYPRTKQAIQLLMRDLETMEELGIIT